jgi:hypothetical protein
MKWALSFSITRLSEKGPILLAATLSHSSPGDEEEEKVREW